MKKLIAMASVVTAALDAPCRARLGAELRRALQSLGFYLGLGVGESTVRSDNNYLYGFNDFNGYYGGPYDYSHHFAWKAAAGIRPISVVGAEFEYFDFGHPGSDTTYYYNNFNYGPTRIRGPSRSLAWDICRCRFPFLDVYGKAGIARLHTNVNGFDGQICVDPAPQCGTRLRRTAGTIDSPTAWACKPTSARSACAPNTSASTLRTATGHVHRRRDVDLLKAIAAF